jgi:dihydrofolate synthase/folylpolyglutamate synthase
MGSINRFLEELMGNYRSLNAWLSWIKAQSIEEIDLSLERVLKIGSRLGILTPTCVVITVAGTNGKGSTVATLEAIYLAGGYQVGAFTTPYLFSYNEQVRLQGNAVEDNLFCDAFERITDACGQDTRLTLFEYGALAAFMIFKEANLDVWLLEVGLGGRWDAVNVIDADVAIVTSIGIDHVNWLGDTRELIAIEKAGIFRKNKPAICGDFDPPVTLIESALHREAPLFCQGKDFGFDDMETSWTWWCLNKRLISLPFSKLLRQNMSTVLMGVELLQSRLPIIKAAIDKALSTVTLSGRIEVISGEVEHIFDVSHNPAAVTLLVDYLIEHPIKGKTYAVFSMLADKDIVSTIGLIKSCIDLWHIAPVESDRAASLPMLNDCFEKENIHNRVMFESVKKAYEKIKMDARVGDRIVVFGSFRTVAEVMILSS